MNQTSSTHTAEINEAREALVVSSVTLVGIFAAVLVNLVALTSADSVTSFVFAGSGLLALGAAALVFGRTCSEAAAELRELRRR